MFVCFIHVCSFSFDLCMFDLFMFVYFFYAIARGERPSTFGVFGLHFPFTKTWTVSKCPFAAAANKGVFFISVRGVSASTPCSTRNWTTYESADCLFCLFVFLFCFVLFVCLFVCFVVLFLFCFWNKLKMLRFMCVCVCFVLFRLCCFFLFYLFCFVVLFCFVLFCCFVFVLFLK